MSSLSSSPNTVHLLSKKSRKLRQDTFFFVPYFGGPLVGGLNQRLTPVTSAKLHRWASILEPAGDDFELLSITIKKTSSVLSYQKVPAGPSIPANSTAPLAPGDYAWKLMGNASYMMPCSRIGDESTFAELKSVQGAEQAGPLEHLAEFLHWYQMPSSLKQSVTARDGGRRWITGSSSYDTEIGVSWIFPPAWGKWLDLPQHYDNPPAISNPPMPC